MKFALIISSLLLSVCINFIEAKKSFDKVLDAQEGQMNVEDVFKHVCHNPWGRKMSRISTLIILDDLMSSPENVCPGKPEYSEIVHQLKQLLDSHKENVCSPQKIDLIEKFHEEFIAKHAKIPYLFLGYFKNYALAISAICKRSLISNVQQLVGKISDDEMQFGANQFFQKLDAKFKSLKGPVKASNDFDDVQLIWNVINKHLLNDPSLSLDNYLDSSEGQQSKRISIKRADAEQIRDVQQRCRRRFKPIYEQLVIPVIRLAQLGYSAKNELLWPEELQKIRSSPLIARWYRIAYICESVLPVQVFDDDSLVEDATVLLSRQEVSQLEQVDEQETIEEEQFEPSGNQIEWDRMMTVYDDDQELVIRLERERVLRQRELNQLISQLKDENNSGFLVKARHLLQSVTPRLTSRAMRKSNQITPDSELDERPKDLGYSIGMKVIEDISVV